MLYRSLQQTTRSSAEAKRSLSASRVTRTPFDSSSTSLASRGPHETSRSRMKMPASVTRSCSSAARH
eukprot:scaffold14127_cov64-Phaeocystis_antarctica.AAC.2